MIRVCYYCGETYGEKPPRSNKEVTHGECPLCQRLFKLWFWAWSLCLTNEPAREFILESRRILAENKTGHRIQKYL